MQVSNLSCLQILNFSFLNLPDRMTRNDEKQCKHIEDNMHSITNEIRSRSRSMERCSGELYHVDEVVFFRTFWNDC